MATKRQTRPKSRPAGKVHTTVHISREALEKLNECVVEMNLRRDMVLNNALGSALSEMKKVRPPASGAARADSILRRNSAKMVRLGLVLDRDIARSITSICRERNVSRDAFVERTMELLVGMGPAPGSPLGHIREILVDPIGWVIQVAGSETDLYGDLGVDLADLLPAGPLRKLRR